MSFELEVHRRNARLRAWRGLGVPVEGGWQIFRKDGGVELRLDLYCGHCGPGMRNILRGLIRTSARVFEGSRMDPAVLTKEEREVLRTYIQSRGYPPGSPQARSCPHLSPLLSRDPPEVRAITELELLAGG